MSMTTAANIVLFSFCMICLAGCKGEVKIHIYDQAGLAALEAFEPTYKLSDDGRIIDLKLEGEKVTDEAVGHLAQLTELKGLSLYGSSITDNGLLPLRELGRLEALGVGKTKITDQGLAHISHIPNCGALDRRKHEANEAWRRRTQEGQTEAGDLQII